MTTIAQRVQRGIALLDKTCPDWRARVDIRTLDMSSSIHGLLEQVLPQQAFPSGYTFVRACYTLGIMANHAGDYGFDIVTDACEDRPQWDALTEAWKQVLEATVTQAILKHFSFLIRATQNDEGGRAR